MRLRLFAAAPDGGFADGSRRLRRYAIGHPPFAISEAALCHQRSRNGRRPA
jgi:hypothetical protein